MPPPGASLRTTLATALVRGQHGALVHFRVAEIRLFCLAEASVLEHQ